MWVRSSGALASLAKSAAAARGMIPAGHGPFRQPAIVGAGPGFDAPGQRDALGDGRREVVFVGRGGGGGGGGSVPIRRGSFCSRGPEVPIV